MNAKERSFFVRCAMTDACAKINADPVFVGATARYDGYHAWFEIRNPDVELHMDVFVYPITRASRRFTDFADEGGHGHDPDPMGDQDATVLLLNSVAWTYEDGMEYVLKDLRAQVALNNGMVHVYEEYVSKIVDYATEIYVPAKLESARIKISELKKFDDELSSDIDV